MITINDIPVNITWFPDNTTQVWQLKPEVFDARNVCGVVVHWDFQFEGEFIQLAQLKDLLDKHDIQSALYLSYLPYGRQDKEISNDATFGLHSFAKLLNTLEFSCVTILDPHSEVALALIKNAVAVYPSLELQHAMEASGANMVCYPDKGAVEKYPSIYHNDFIRGIKHRDQATGRITRYQLVDSAKGKHVMIVDDICDGGGTFTILAARLIEGGAESVDLFVSHGIFSKGIKPLKEAGIRRIFTPKGEAVDIRAANSAAFIPWPGTEISVADELKALAAA